MVRHTYHTAHNQLSSQTGSTLPCRSASSIEIPESGKELTSNSNYRLNDAGLDHLVNASIGPVAQNNDMPDEKSSRPYWHRLNYSENNLPSLSQTPDHYSGISERPLSRNAVKEEKYDFTQPLWFDMIIELMAKSDLPSKETSNSQYSFN